MKNAIMKPRLINATGTATAACMPGEHIPLHFFCSERTDDVPAVEAAAGTVVKDVLSVALVGIIVIEDVGMDPLEEVDIRAAAADV
jgi:hypothetical protein